MTAETRRVVRFVESRHFLHALTARVMGLFIGLLVSSVVFPGSFAILAQNAADDPGGWKDLKWGISRDEIVKSMSDVTSFKNRYGDTVFGLPSFFIDQVKFEVALLGTDKPEHLNGVELGSLSVRTSDGTLLSDPARAIANVAKTMLLEKLTDKYGKPTQVREDADNHYWDWIFPSTKITLRWLEYKDPYYQNLNRAILTYSKRQKSDDL